MTLVERTAAYFGTMGYQQNYFTTRILHPVNMDTTLTYLPGSGVPKFRQGLSLENIVLIITLRLNSAT